MALTKVSYSMITGAQVNVLDYGADPTGVANSSSAFTAAYADAVAGGGEMFIPPGTYLGQFVFSGEAPVRGAGIRRTVLKPSNTASYCVRLYGIGGDANLGATISNLSITSTTKTGKGLECGDRAFTSGCSNALIERLEISGFEENITLSMCLLSTFRQVYSYGGVYGIAFDGEANVTTLHFDSCRFRLNDYGIYARTGLNVIWTNCNSESNVLVNLWLRTGLTNGPAEWIFNTCWFENITGSSGSRYCIFLDMLSAIAATKPMNVRFNYCTISAPETIPDVRADRAQDVIFDHCYFSSTPDAFTSAKFSYATGTAAVRIRLLNCGQTQAVPTETMYASFPALTRVSGGVFGFFYEFTQVNGKRFTNYEVLSASTVVTSLQTAYATTLVCDTTSAGFDINSLNGGSDGQVLRIVKPVSANTLTIKNNGTGTEKILTASGADVALTGREGITLVCDGSSWYESQYT